MGHLKDVFCWCEGGARELVIRWKNEPTFCLKGEGLKQNTTNKTTNTKKTTKKDKEVLRIVIPEGIYVMNGGEKGRFQKEYTHEFPEVHPALFKKMQSAFQKNVVKYPDFPRNVVLSEKGSSRLHLLQADYIANHPIEAKDVVNSFSSMRNNGGISTKKQKTLDF